MAKITTINNGDSGLVARGKMNEALASVEIDASLTGDGNVGTPIAVANPLSAAEVSALTGGGDSTLHFHATDRALANATGTLAVGNGGTGVTTIAALKTALGFTFNTPFTPSVTIGGSSVGVTYAAQSGYYDIIDKIVRFNLYISVSSDGGLTGAVVITGLPIASRGNANGQTPVAISNAGGITATNIHGFIGIASTSIILKVGLTTLNDTDYPSSFALFVAGTYPIA